MINKIDKKNEEKSRIRIGFFIEVGKILATALKDYPHLAAVCLIFLIAALVTIFIRGNVAIIAFFILATILCVIILFKKEIYNQTEQVRKRGKESIKVKEDTISLASRMSDVQKEDVRKILRGATTLVADILNIPHNLVRANLFGVDDHNRLRMLKELMFHMDREEELTISMPVGYGSTGRCFRHKTSNIAVFREGWGKDTIDDEELRKVHPDLQWIISVPVLAGKDRHPIWVMNVDGLRERREEERLRKVISPLLHCSELLSYIIKETISKTRR